MSGENYAIREIVSAPTGAEPNASITCACGFRVVGADESLNAEVFEDHECPRGPERWYHAVFSPWTVFLAAVLGFGIAMIVEVASR